MEKLYIQSTSSSPEINFSPEENIFIIRGKSSPEDVREMYYPVIDWIREFVDGAISSDNQIYTSDSPLKFQSDLVYFNSSSAKFLHDIFLELKRLSTAGIEVVIEWFYDEGDSDMKEAGTDIALLAEMEFVYLAKTR